MGKIEKHKQRRFGLIGRNISYSFSSGYFTQKFEQLNLLNHSYENFDLKHISEVKHIIAQKDIVGLNVTIPYKEAIIPFLDQLDVDAEAIGAVNTIKFTQDGLIGYNTDAYGFKTTLSPLLKKNHKKALILGTGGASKAIAFVLKELSIEHQYVSRNPTQNQLNYTDLNEMHYQEFQLFINCSPVGTHPNIHEKPQIPYQFFNKSHILFDLIYNPTETTFLSEGKKRGATIQNGLSMLQHQAEKAWDIWNAD